LIRHAQKDFRGHITAYSLQQLSDLADIRIFKDRIFRGIDTPDEALLSGLFTEDVQVNYRGGIYRAALSAAPGPRVSPVL
jgi:hypothetical protein